MLTKVCTTCGVDKSVAEYYKHKGGRYGVRSYCKICDNQRCAKRYEANRDVELEKRKSWYEANRETQLEQKKVYYKVNKKILIEKNKAYYKANPHIGTAKSAKRRAITLDATPSWANKEHIESLYLIASINRQGGYDLHVDHIVPLQSDIVCGLHCEANLQLLQASDNLSKSNRHWPDMW